MNPENALLATYLALAIFAAGDEGNRKVTRIAFKTGKWPDGEKDQGGLNCIALAGVIQQALDRRELGKVDAPHG